MMYRVGFSPNYEAWPPLEDMLTAEADNPQAAIEQVLRDGKGPADRRMRCACVVSTVQNRKDKTTLFWLDFDGHPRPVGGYIHWP